MLDMYVYCFSRLKKHMCLSFARGRMLRVHVSVVCLDVVNAIHAFAFLAKGDGSYLDFQWILFQLCARMQLD